MDNKIKNQNELFTNLFVLELANNHWGSVERGKEIIRQHGRVVTETGVKAAVKFQFRDVDTFVHDAFKPNQEIEREGEVVEAPGSSSRYIKKTIATKLTPAEFAELLAEVRAHNMLTMATPFDEKSVDWCRDLDIDIVKIASQDAKSWVLVERIAELGKPTIISNGGTDIADLDRVVKLFESKNVPLAINHCVSMYPSEDNELELNQVDYMKKRYPNHVIGYSTHEYKDWYSSVQITYAKGARTWERHIDIEDAEGTPVSKYCSLPNQTRVWFEAFKKAKEMMGGGSEVFRLISEKERDYVQSVSRGAYALRDLALGEVISKKTVGIDFQFVIPLQANQLSSRDLDTDVTLTKEVKKGEPITLSVMDSMVSNGVNTPWAKEEIIRALIDGGVRSVWLLAIVTLAVMTNFWIAGTWTMLLTGLLSLTVGITMTVYHRYDLYPGMLRTVGAYINGLLLGGVTISMFGMVYVGAPLYMLWVMLAVGMVVTALMSRLGNVLSSYSLARYLLGVSLLLLTLVLVGKSVEFQSTWLYFVYAIVGFVFLEQISIKIFKTGVLLPWVHLLWGSFGFLTIGVGCLFLFPAPLSIALLLSAPIKIGILSLLIATLFVVSTWTRITMRKAPGLFVHKRLVGISVLCLFGFLVGQVVLYPLIFGLFLGASLIFGDRTNN